MDIDRLNQATETNGAAQLAAEVALQPELFSMVLDTICDRIFLKDADGRLTFVNQSFLKSYGLSADQVIGKRHHDFLPGEMIDACAAADAHVLEHGEATCLETRWRNAATGEQRWSETHKAPLRDADGNITGIVGVSRDITARRKTEEELKRKESLLLHASRLSSLGELAAGIAHEVNQPLYSILNYAKAIENSLHDDGSSDLTDVRKWVRQIHEESSRGGKITLRLKSFARLTESQRKPSTINTSVCESLEFMRIEAKDAGVALDTELEENLPELTFDRIQIQQVLVNLVKNAIEACVEHGTPNARVLTSTRQLPDHVLISVADNGPGVRVSDGTSILDPFQTTKHEGLGLGLAISNTIVEAHHGRLTYESNSLGGATFSFALPITDQHVHS